MKILWIIPKWTLPVNDGAKVATDSLLRNTRASGAVIDVLCLTPEHQSGDEKDLQEYWGIRNVIKINRRAAPGGRSKYFYHLKNFIKSPHIPLTFTPYFDKEVVSAALKAVHSDSYDFLLLDGLHLGALFLKGSLPSHCKIIYRAHNVEADLWKRSFQEKKNLVIKLLLLYQAKLVESIERTIIERSSLVASIAQEDKTYLSLRHPGARIELVPLGLNFTRSLAFPASKTIQFLFIGKLDWSPNKDGLKWLLDEVWPVVNRLRPEACLKIVGSGDGSWLSEYKNREGLIVEGFVKDIEDAYRDCHFTIVPVFYGSGTRIKVIESFVMNRRLISTSMGVQGANLRPVDFEKAETKEEWIKLLSTITFNEAMKIKTFESKKYMASTFCEQKVGQDFYNSLATMS